MSNQLRKLNIFGEFRKPKEPPNSRIREFVLSNGTKDRHGTIIPPDSWDLSKFSGTAFYQHESSTTDPDLALGPATVYRDGDEIIMGIDFEPKELNELADKILRKIDNGTLKNSSAGFIAHQARRGDKKLMQWNGKPEDETAVYLTKNELLEGSVVHIPSNHQAQLRKAEDDLIEFLASIEPKESTEPKPAHSTKRARVQFLSLQK